MPLPRAATLLIVVALLIGCSAASRPSPGPPTITVRADVEALHGNLAQFTGRAGNSKWGPFVTGAHLACYLRGCAEWPQSAMGHRVTVVGRFHVWVVPADPDGDRAGPAPGSTIVWVEVRSRAITTTADD